MNIEFSLISQETLENKLINNRPVVLFGAGIYLEPSLHSLRQKSEAQICIVDNDSTKQNNSILGYPVYSLEHAIELYPDAIFIITSAPKHINGIKKQIESHGISDVFDCASLLARFEYQVDSFSFQLPVVLLDLDIYFYDYFLLFFPEKLIIKNLDIVITEKCSLKCKDCSNLMQYYTNPQDADFDTLFRSLDKLMSEVDYVMELRVLGGEAFVNKRLHDYLKRLRKYKNYARIVVYSNGTIIPKNENLTSLKSSDTYIRISNYIEASKNTHVVVDVLRENEIPFIVEDVERWQDCAEIGKHSRTKAELEAVYAECCVKDSLTLLNDRLYICPFSANADNIGAIPKFEDEMIAFATESPGEIRNRIIEMLRQKTFFKACVHCNGRPISEMPLDAAIQVKQPIPYKKYQ